jgi:hypothetical protein
VKNSNTAELEDQMLLQRNQMLSLKGKNLSELLISNIKGSLKINSAVYIHVGKDGYHNSVSAAYASRNFTSVYQHTHTSRTDLYENTI